MGDESKAELADGFVRRLESRNRGEALSKGVILGWMIVGKDVRNCCLR